MPPLPRGFLRRSWIRSELRNATTGSARTRLTSIRFGSRKSITPSLDGSAFENFCRGRLIAERPELSVYVRENFRRRGIGRRLLQAAIARAPQLNLHTLVGLIFAQNQPSIELFRTVGFERWGLLPGVARIDYQARDLAIFGRPV